MKKVLHTKFGTARLYNGYFRITDGKNKNKIIRGLSAPFFYRKF